MRRFLPLALVLTSACATVEAQTAPAPAAKPAVAAPAAAPITPAKRAKAEQLLVLLKLDTGLQGMLSSTATRIHTLAQQQAAQAKTPEQQKLATDYTAKIDAMTTSALDYAKLRGPLADVYASNFTDAELDSIIAFYGSPAGKVFVDKTQPVGEQTNAIFQGVLKDLQPKLADSTREFQTNLKAATPPTISTPENMKDTPPPAAPAPAPKK